VSFLDPFKERDLIDRLALAGVSAVSLEMIPRTTLAQKMDVLSSQANLSGYQAVILGAERFERILPMMMTPAGTISPARVFVIGVGVAGLQAIATLAKRARPTKATPRNSPPSKWRSSGRPWPRRVPVQT
jgi:NAD(P) transhydrogenase subunit alpha